MAWEEIYGGIPWKLYMIKWGSKSKLLQYSIVNK
jgi:hypothetical protein